MADFAEVVRRFMTERGMSLRSLARETSYDVGYLSKVLNGRKPCSPHIAKCLDAALDAEGSIIEAAEHDRDGQYAVSKPDAKVAPELADYFSDQLAGHYVADRFLGPARLIPTATSQYELLCDLASESSGTLRASLWGLAAGYAAFLGWLHQDAGDLATAARWLDVMIERSHRSQDLQLVCFALYDKAMLLADMGDAHGVLDLTGAALQHGSRLSPKVKILLLQQAAHGIALTGTRDDASCDQLLDEAAGLLDAIDDDYPWGGSCQTPRYIDIQRATIYTRLGRTREALNLWEQLIPGIPVSSRRDLGVFRARHAQALAAAGYADHAVAIAREVAPLVGQTGSARMRAELVSGLRERMEPWNGTPQGRALAEALSVIPRKRSTGGGKWRPGTK